MSATETADRNRAAFLEGRRRREERRMAFAQKYPMLTVECPECHGEGIIEVLHQRPWSVSRSSNYCHVCQGMLWVTEEFAKAFRDYKDSFVNPGASWSEAAERFDAALSAMREEVKLANNRAVGIATGEEGRMIGAW